METNSLGSICFQSFGGNMMGQQKIQNMLIKGEGKCFYLTPGGWVGVLNTPRNTQNFTGPTFHHSSTPFQIFAQPFGRVQHSWFNHFFLFSIALIFKNCYFTCCFQCGILLPMLYRKKFINASNVTIQFFKIFGFFATDLNSRMEV